MITIKNALSTLAILTVFSLFACGGGGGGTPGPTVIAPSIATPPANRSVLSGDTASFSVVANGTAPLTYQWQKGTTAIPLATQANYTTPAASLGDDQSSYRVVVSNSAGSATSAPAVLSVLPRATTLDYVDPIAPGMLQLKKNVALSTPGTHLVLDLVGSAALSSAGSGITATFSVDTSKATWANVAAGDPVALVQNGSAFNLGLAPQILKGKLTGSSLQVIAAQKGTGSPKALNAPLLRIALDLSSTPQTTGNITLSSDNAKCQIIDNSGAILEGLTVSIGTLKAQ
jgi:hypothetical protein